MKHGKELPIDVALPDDPEDDVSVTLMDWAGIAAFVLCLFAAGFFIGRFTA